VEKSVDYAAPEIITGVVDISPYSQRRKIAGVAIWAKVHCRPEIVAAIKAQTDKLMHLPARPFMMKGDRTWPT
jgi:hypothetical protein